LGAAAVATASALAAPRVVRAGTPPARWIARPTRGCSSDPDLADLAARAVDAARSAGATYADARLTQGRAQSIVPIGEFESRAIGVRALVNGYWGFLASSVWTADEAARLARGAVAQASAEGHGRTRAVELAATPVVDRGRWVMPVKYDPFDIPIGEKLDVMAAFSDVAARQEIGIGTTSTMDFAREYKVFASSEGASWSQTTYRSSASFSVSYPDSYHAGLPGATAAADCFSTAGRGWEYIAESGLADAIPRLVDEAKEARYQVPFDIGRYDMVFSADAMATLLDETIGPATELDRAVGYEANASGTSYLGPNPLELLGSYVVGSPLLTVVANRSLAGGVATVRWDDGGVAPEEFTVVKDGALVDYQTTREQATWLAPYYQRLGRPIRSHGCANASSALAITMQHAPNLALMPGKNDTSFDDLVAGTERGIAVLSLSVRMDQQLLNGMAAGTMREIRRGKLGRYLVGGAIVFRTPELWKNLVAIGGPRTVAWSGTARSKGEPRQRTDHSIGAVPGKITQLSLVDLRRRV